MNLGLSGTLVTQSYEQGDGLKMGDGITVSVWNCYIIV